MRLIQFLLSAFLATQCASQLIPGTLQICEYWRLLGKLSEHPECAPPPTTQPPPPPTTPYTPPTLAICIANAALTSCSTDAILCPLSRTVCIQSNNNRCCQGTNPGIPVSDINAKAGSCPAPLGISTAQDVTVGCWLDNNCPGIQKCCVEPNPVTNSASRVCRDPIGVSGTAICNAPLAVGSCSSFVTRYYYDTASGQCRSFQYSGCGGNSNNFNSLSICQSTCGGVGVTGSSQCPADANIGLNCQFARPNACNTDADCIGRVNTVQPTCCVTSCGYKICYQNY